jgi:hypothetical protein
MNSYEFNKIFLKKLLNNMITKKKLVLPRKKLSEIFRGKKRAIMIGCKTMRASIIKTLL